MRIFQKEIWYSFSTANCIVSVMYHYRSHIIHSCNHNVHKEVEERMEKEDQKAYHRYIRSVYYFNCLATASYYQLLLLQKQRINIYNFIAPWNIKFTYISFCWVFKNVCLYCTSLGRWREKTALIVMFVNHSLTTSHTIQANKKFLLYIFPVSCMFPQISSAYSLWKPL